MKKLKNSARSLNTTLNILFFILLAYGTFTVGYHTLALRKLLTDPDALSGKMGLTVGWLTLNANHGFGITLDTAVKMKLIQLVSAGAYTVIGCCAIRILKHILLPIEVGQPFRSGISEDIIRLSKHAVYLGMTDNLYMLAAVILIENYYELPTLLMHDPITTVAIDWDLKPVWFIVAGVLSCLAMVFRHGEQLQQLADETL